ncbi:MAG: lipase maturation factor family protein [Acidobacteriota bacterium]
MDDDLHVPTPADTWARWLRPRDYVLTRWLVLRLLGVVYVFAFLGILFQALPLIGSHGLTPASAVVEHATFWQLPSVFVWDCSDTALMAWAYVGLALSIALVAGYANLPSLLVLWLIYGSYERVGQLWWGFGWEIQIVETTLLAAFLAHPWDPRPLRAPAPTTTSIVLMRWLVFRIMLGAGLIKLRGDSCWTELTCLDGHFETQPIPNPLSPWFHHLPHAVHAGGVVFNHIVECVAPFFVFGPRPLRLVAGLAMLSFQGVLIASGNLAFLNWLTIVPILACFDDDALLRLVPARWRDRLRARRAPRVDRNGWQLALAITVTLGAILLYEHASALEDFFAIVVLVPAIAFFATPDWRRWLVPRLGKPDARQIVVGMFAALVIFKSLPVVDNLTSHHQAMNRSYDRLELVNTYGAFGSVGMERYELVIEGTLDADPATAHWAAYELPCKPGDLARRPCVLGPYHRRLDWLIWFAAMDEVPREAWVIHLVWKLLDGDRGIRTLLAVDPFAGQPPKWVRIRRFRYHFAPPGSDAWWTRDDEKLWLEPVSLATPGLRDALARFGWPSPTLH